MSELKRADFFPTSIWYSQVEGADEINKKLIKLIYKLRDQDPGGVSKSNSMGYQSQDDLQTLHEFDFIRTRAVDVLKEILVFLKAEDGMVPEITTMWANINPKNSQNLLHCHANSFLSVAYYVKTPEKCGDIVFHDPRVQQDALRPPMREPSFHTLAEVGMTPRAGFFYVFPGWLQHRVVQNQSEEDRISLAFNSWLF